MENEEYKQFLNNFKEIIDGEYYDYVRNTLRTEVKDINFVDEVCYQIAGDDFNYNNADKLNAQTIYDAKTIEEYVKQYLIIKYEFVIGMTVQEVRDINEIFKGL